MASCSGYGNVESSAIFSETKILWSDTAQNYDITFSTLKCINCAYLNLFEGVIVHSFNQTLQQFNLSLVCQYHTNWIVWTHGFVFDFFTWWLLLILYLTITFILYVLSSNLSEDQLTKVIKECHDKVSFILIDKWEVFLLLFTPFAWYESIRLELFQQSLSWVFINTVFESAFIEEVVCNVGDDWMASILCS